MSLDDDEVNAIGEAMNMASPGPRDASPFALIGPDVASQASLVALGQHAHTLARAVAVCLQANTHMRWTVTAEEPRVASFADAAAGGVVGVRMPVANAEPAFLVAGDDDAGQIVAAQLGASDDSGRKPGRRLSILEKQLAVRLMRALGDEVASTLRSVGIGRLSGGCDADLAGLERGDVAAVLMRITCSAPVNAKLELVVPTSWFAGTRKKASNARSLAEHIPSMELEVVVELGRLERTLAQLQALAPGDVLPLLTTEHTPLPVLVQDEPRFYVRPDVRDGKIVCAVVKDPRIHPIVDGEPRAMGRHLDEGRSRDGQDQRRHAERQDERAGR
jgi:flagellar motor switch/type III secretory pathway protein FliN